MKIVSFNVNGIRAAANKGVLNSIREMQADVVCLQETKATVSQVQETLVPLLNEGHHVFANEAERKGYSGTAIITKQKPIGVTYDIGLADHDKEGRVITAEFSEFYLVNVYVPNSGSELVRLDYRKRWDEAMLNYLKVLEKLKPVVFCGDLNVAHRPIDLKNDKANYNKSAGYTQTEIDGMDNYIEGGLVDSFREINPDTEKYSWWSFRANARARNIGWRIDYVLMSQALVPRLREAFILNDVMGSDHCPVGVMVEDLK